MTHDASHVDKLSDSRAFLSLACENVEQLQVPLDVSPGIGSLDLDDHPLSGRKGGTVDLGDGACGERLIHSPAIQPVGGSRLSLR